MFCKHCGKNIYDLEKCPFCANGENIEASEKNDVIETEPIGAQPTSNEPEMISKTTANNKLQFESSKDAIEHWSNTSPLGKAKRTLESVFAGIFFAGLLLLIVIYFISSRSVDLVEYIEKIGVVRGFLFIFLILWVFSAFRSSITLLGAISRKSQADWMKREKIDCRKILKYGKKLDKSSDADLKKSLLVSEHPSNSKLFFAEYIISVVASVVSSIALSWIVVSLVSGIYNGIEYLGLTLFQAAVAVFIRFDILFFIVVELAFAITNTVLSKIIKERAEGNLLSGE